ncbi:MAG: tetratricopeptide repeat protein [Planctomycetota bacterium]|nr:tetratricopeptide repeat protein [Planctomycetota bacterium]
MRANLVVLANVTGIVLMYAAMAVATDANSKPGSRGEGPADNETMESNAEAQSSGNAAANTEEPGALRSEESLARFQQLLHRRPFHKPAFAGLVKHFAEQGRLQDLVQEYEEKVKALPNDESHGIVLARLYLRVGQFKKSAELVDGVELTDPSPGELSKLLVFKSEVYQRNDRMDAARSMLRQALDQAKTVSARFKLTEALADLHIRSKESSAAADVLIALAEDFPDNYLHQKRIADALGRRDLHEQAIERYHGILELVKDRTDVRCEVLRQLGKSLERLERRQDAISVYVEATNLLSGGHWLQRELHERIVTLYRASGRLSDLVEYCREQIERTPEQTAMRGLLADVLEATGDKAAAKEAMAEAVQLFPKNKDLSERRIRLLERIGDAEGVAAEYERVITRHPEDAELYIDYGRFLADNEQLEAARNQWKHVLNSEVTDATLARRLGGLFEPYELYDDAVECYERSITLRPERAESYTALSRLWFYRGKKDKALDALHRMARANPDDTSIHATLCDSLMNLGLIDEALQAITRACELDAGEVRYRLNRADLLVQLGRVDEALIVRRESLALVRNPRRQATAIEVLVSMSASVNQLDALKAKEETRLAETPHDSVSLLLLAKAADTERDFGDARRWLSRILESEPSHEEARRQLARLFEATGDLDMAVDAYRKLIDLHPSRGRQYYQAIADVRLRYNDKAGAVETFEKMVQSAPNNATVLKSVAEQLVRLDELEKAIGYYEQSLQSQPNRHEIRLEYAKALYQDGQLDEALAAFKTTALQRTDRDSAIEALGKLHETAGQLGQLDELLQELQARIETDPEDTLVARTLAQLLIREYEYNRAMEMLDLVLRHNPRDADLQLVRGELFRRLARFDDAVETYRDILRVPNVDRDFVYGEMGKAYFEAGQIEQAKVTWRRINHKLYAGTLLRNNGLIEDAIDVLREGIRLKPDDFGLHRNLFRALQAAGRIDESLKAARRLLDLEPDNVFNIQQLASAYLERGDRETAAEIAGRLFSAGVAEKKGKKSSSSSRWSSMGGMPIWAMGMQSSWFGFGGQPARNNLERGVRFFQENGLLAELEEILDEQLKAQPDNAILRQTAVTLFAETFGKPESALSFLKELETATFPIEHQVWLGQCSQRDFMRIRQYQLIASKPALRDRRLTELNPKPVEELTRDERIELAVIRQSQGSNDQAIELLQDTVEGESGDVVAFSVLVDMLVRAERFEEAEAPVLALIQLLAGERERMESQMIERVRRDFVRTLPLQFQVRVSEDLLRDIARKWTLGQGMLTDFTGFAQTMGYLRAKLTSATIFAKTDRMEQARRIWKELAPSNPADADSWTMLAGVAQLHEQNDLAYDFYEKALHAAKVLMTDPLLQRVYSGSMSSSWFGGEEAIDTAFNKIVEAFAGRDKLAELYDFLRETDQTVKARRVAEQFDLYDELESRYRQRVEAASETFRQSGDDPLNRSVPYFTQVCKLAEVLDQTGDWPAAQATYEQYLRDFPDELGLLITLGEVAERQTEYEAAIEWEKKVVDTKQRLARKTRHWMLRSVYMTPAMPRILVGDNADIWSWQQRWGRSYGWYGSRSNPLERWPSWLRIAQLYLALDEHIAASDAMERAIGAARGDRENVAHQILSLVRQRQLIAKLLPVLRSLAVHLPTDEPIQLAFAESLEENDKMAVASEVYRRMLRRGVTDVATLARVRDNLKRLAPDATEDSIDTLASLEATVAADPDNANNRLRLAKAYFYSLKLDEALENLQALEKVAPHLKGLPELLVEIHTIRGNSEELVEALRTNVARARDEDKRRKIRHRLVEELFALGKKEEALDTLKELVDPKDPSSYQRVGMLLHYFGRHDVAVEQFVLAGRSQAGRSYRADPSDAAQARAMVLKGDLTSAADKILEAIDKNVRQATQYAGMAGAFSMFDRQENHFDPFVSVFVIRPELVDEIRNRLDGRHQDNPEDPQAARLLMQFHRRVGRADLAEAILDEMTEKGVTDQALVTRLIDRAIERREYPKAIELAETWIAQQPKPKLPPGMPAQYAGMMALMSARNRMVCKLGDVYWKTKDEDKAFETYRQILDEKIDETRIAYAAICMMRGRIDEARELVENALAEQKVKSPNLLQFRSVLAAADDEPEKAFDDLAKATEIGAGQAANPFNFGGGGDSTQLLAGLAKRTGLLDRFSAFMRKQIKKNPNQWKNHRLLAQTYYEAGRVEEAFEVLDEAAEIKSLKRDVLEQRVRWQEGYAPVETLIDSYQVLIKASERKVKAKSSSAFSRFFGGSSQPERPVDTQPLRNRLGDLFWDRGQHDLAEQVWTKRMNLKSAASHADMGRRYMQKRAFDRAEQSFAKALKLDPNHMAAHRALAELAFHRQDGETAVGHIREVFLKQYGEDQSSRRRRNPRQNIQNQRQSPNESLRDWAMELARDSTLVSRLRESAADEDVEKRLALATLTGQWDAVEKVLRRRLDEAPFDPMIRTLWARLLERKGEWNEATEAWEYIRRLRRTSIPERRDRLKLVLAGKHIKDAAAGSKTAPMSGPAAASSARSVALMQSMYYPGRGGYDLNKASTHLAGLYVKLEQFEKAELLYLFRSENSSAERVMPQIANLMWRQGAKDRALELFEMAVILSENADLIPQYAGLLAEVGRHRDAADLLIRSYRCIAQQNAGYGYSFYFGARGNEQFEDYRESACATALYDILRRNGELDSMLTDLNKQAVARPEDSRLTKLVLSLQIRDRRWSQARDSLNAWRKARPEDLAIKTELLHIHYQLEDWDAALELLEALKQNDVGQADPWRLHEAFVRLMQGDAAGAVTAIEPLIDSSLTETTGASFQSVQTVLAAARDYDRLIELMEARDARQELDESSRGLLCRLYQIRGRWNAAARLTLDQIWNSPKQLDAASPAYRTLVASVRGAESAGKMDAIEFDRPEDKALVGIVEFSAKEGRSAFLELVGQQPDNINARRGLVFAAALEGDFEAAAEANAALLDWLDSRRRQVWRNPKSRPLGETVRAFLEGVQKQNADSSSAMQLSMQYAQMLGQALGLNDSGSQGQPVMYETLWMAYEQLQRDLLLSGRRTEELVTLLKSQADYAEAQALQGSQGSRAYTYYGGPFGTYGTTRYGVNRNREGFETDWRQAVQAGYKRYRLLEQLVDLFNDLGTRLPRSEWRLAGEAYAALGRQAEARNWGRKAADAELTQVRADDGPQVASTDNSYSWRWRMYGRSAAQELQKLRSALRVTVKPQPDEDAEDRIAPFVGPPDQLWEYALLDPEVEAQLLQLSESLGPGWDNSRTLELLIAYHRAKKQPQEIIELIDRVCELEELLQSQRLKDYLQACFDAGDWDRVEKVLAAVGERSLVLENEVSLVRIMALRHQGNDTDADLLEGELIERCIDEPENPRRLDPELLSSANRSLSRRFNFPMNMMWQNAAMASRFLAGYSQTRSDLPTIPSLARALGVRFQAKVRAEDMTLNRIRDAYARHGLYRDAIRILDLELARKETRISPRERARLAVQKARWLKGAEDPDSARGVLSEVESFWRSEANRRPHDPAPIRALTNIYASKPYGPDPEKALQSLLAARRLDPAFDESRRREAKLLYEMGRYQEAWKGYDNALNRGKMENANATDLYRAGLAAHKGGQTVFAVGLLRQALWRRPDHTLADQARELIHE